MVIAFSIGICIDTQKENCKTSWGRAMLSSYPVESNMSFLDVDLNIMSLSYVK